MKVSLSLLRLALPLREHRRTAEDKEQMMHRIDAML